jgi:hypothetical protein
MPSGDPDGPEMLQNGTFGTGTTSGWSLFGTLTSQVDAGVFEFTRETGTPPAGVILQPTGQGLASGEILTATFELGNSSAVRKRVTVLLHDNDFSDLSACTFWLAPGQVLSPYAMRGFATKTWTNATVSFYAATVGTETWSRLDNVSLRKTASAAIVGTECGEPGSGLTATGNALTSAAAPGTASTSATTGRGGNSRISVSSTGTGQTAAPRLSTAAPRSLEFSDASTTEAFDLTNAAGARLFVQSWLPEGQGQVQISLDGMNWAALGDVGPSREWTSLDTDLGAWTGHVILIRFVRAGDVTTAGPWRLRNLRVEVDRQRDRNR